MTSSGRAVPWSMPAFASERISGFYLSQPGQHDLTPIGGDNIHSPGAKESPEGVVQGAGAGAAVGIVAGAATAPVTGPLGPVVGGLVGAHVGSLFSFSKMKDPGDREEGGRAPVENRRPACSSRSPSTIPAWNRAPSTCCATWAPTISSVRRAISSTATGPISTRRRRPTSFTDTCCRRGRGGGMARFAGTSFTWRSTAVPAISLFAFHQGRLCPSS
jgi:hypothetical protein